MELRVVLVDDQGGACHVEQESSIVTVTEN